MRLGAPIRGWHTVHRLPKLHLIRMIHSCRTHGKARSTGCSFEIWQINASQRARHQSQRRTRALVEGLVPWLGSADQERSSVLRELPSGTSCEGTFRGKLKKEKNKKRKRKEKKSTFEHAHRNLPSSSGAFPFPSSGSNEYAESSAFMKCDDG